MTQNYKNFKINEIMVFQKNLCILEATFKSGLNIIHGSNSAGKSTLLDILVHSLGGEEIKFTPIVKKCTHVLTELEVEGDFITLFREIDPTRTKIPISIFYGKITDAIFANDNEWSTFTYNSFSEKFGFSKIFFDFLGYPETVSTETTITTHQLLRVLYADQANNHLPIFRYEKWDNSEKRLAIRDYIFGLFTGELYEQQLIKKSLSKQLDDSINKLQSIFKILGKSSNELVEDLILAEQSKFIETKEIILNKIKELTESKEIIGETIDQQVIQSNLQIQLTQLNKVILTLQEKITNQHLEIVDLENFNNELNLRAIELNNSITSNNLISNINFDFCPCCHTKLEIDETDSNFCKLCKNETSEQVSKANLLQMKSELNFQIQETNKLIKEEKVKFTSFNNTLKEKTNQFSSLKQEFDLLTNRWHTSYELSLLQAYKDLGEVETELKNIDSRLVIAKEIKELEMKRDNLQHSLKNAELTIEKLINNADHKLKKILYQLNDNLKKLLAKDIGVQEEFLDPDNNVEVVFEDNCILVNGAGHFSQSSMIVLRQLFHLALLQLSLQDSAIRMPRFIILDGINDGGLEKERAKNLQDIIVNTCSTFKKPFQLICSSSELHVNFKGAHKLEYLNSKRTLNIK